MGPAVPGLMMVFTLRTPMMMRPPVMTVVTTLFLVGGISVCLLASLLLQAREPGCLGSDIPDERDRP
jgi:hypothetical protein